MHDVKVVFIGFGGLGSGLGRGVGFQGGCRGDWALKLAEVKALPSCTV